MKDIMDEITRVLMVMIDWFEKGFGFGMGAVFGLLSAGAVVGSVGYLIYLILIY